MNISLNELKDLLSSAFDSGWFGYKDTKDDCIEKIIEDYLEKNPIKNQFPTMTVSTSLENIDPAYYSYYAWSDGPQLNTTNTTNTNEII